MGLLPAPKLRDLAAWSREDNSRTVINSDEVWEIGVPAKKSLSWSIVLSVLFSVSGERFPEFLQKLTGNEFQVKEIKRKKKLSSQKVDPDLIKRKLDSMNPFKNRHNFFHWKEVSEIVLIFDIRLKRCADSLRSESNEAWNDDLKLKAASNLLQCKIDVYFPDNADRIKTYQGKSSNLHTDIVLFQYENQKHGARKDPINIFSFAMKPPKTHDLKLDALKHFLKKAKADISTIDKIMKCMESPEAHGTAFLPTIMENNCIAVLPKIFRFPYITLKLSEAGFDTDPTARISGKPSPLGYTLLCSTDTTYLRILYDYASNCRSLFNRSVRRADDTVLQNLENIKKVVEEDIATVDRCNFGRVLKERAQHILKQLHRLIEYQFKTAKDSTDLKNKLKNKQIDSFQFRNQIIKVLTEHYLTFFHCEEQSENISRELNNFISYSEYYGFMDNFFHISFFDNFFKLKLSLGLSEVHLLSSNVEWKLFLAMKSNKYFPKYEPEDELRVKFNDMRIDGNRSILRYVPLHHRNVVKNEVHCLRQLLYPNECSNGTDLAIVKKELEACSHTLPQVFDELIMARLDKYLEAVQEISPTDDGMRAVLVIERAMQVIGESIKPPSSRNSIVSFLLRSCLPSNLQKDFINIRNDLSKCRCNSVFGKLEVEKDKKYFEEIKNELLKIRDIFKVVSFTQYLRIEESVMSDCLDQLKNCVEPSTYEELVSEYDLRLQQRTVEYEKYHRKCIDLLLDSFSDLHEESEKTGRNINQQNQNIYGQLKSIEYLLEFIANNRNEKYLSNLLNDVLYFYKTNKDNHDEEIEKLVNSDDGGIIEEEDMKKVVERQLNDLKHNLSVFLPKCVKEILKHNPKKEIILLTPKIKSFFENLKQKAFLKEEIESINSAYEDALEEANKAKSDVEGILKKDFEIESIPKLEESLKKILLQRDKLGKIKSCYRERKPDAALNYLKKCIGSDKAGSQKSKIMLDVKKMLEDGSLSDSYATTVLTKIVFQRNSDIKYYTSPTLSNEIYKKLENFLTHKVKTLLNRLEILKNILIDEDEDIKATWQWGKNEAIKYHSKFLMRQRYIREPTVSASLEMAYFDCVNIFHKPLQNREKEKLDELDSRNPLASLYEKSTDLFAGSDLRVLVSHRNNYPEVVGEILDEDDFPSEMIGKMLQLIDDTDAIKAMLELFVKYGVIEEDNFKDSVKDSLDSDKYSKLKKTINACPRWERYLPLLPFIK